MSRLPLIPITVAFAVILSVSGCSPSKPPGPSPTTSSVSDRIAICSGGVSHIYGANFAADLSDIMQGRGGLTAEAKREIKGLFLSRDDISQEVALRVFELYLECVEAERAFERQQEENAGDFGLSELQCRTYRRCEASVMGQYSSCIEIVEKEATSQAQLNTLNNRMCQPILSGFQPCWDVSDRGKLNLRRAICKSKFPTLPPSG